MFRDTINNTALTSSEADVHFENITGQSYGGDKSFLSTLRALIAPRMSEGDRLSLYYSTSYNYLSAPESRFVRDMFEEYNLTGQNYILIHDLQVPKEEGDKILAAVKAEFTKCFTNFSRLDKIQAFFQKSFGTDCYIDPERKITVLITSGLDIKKYHYIQAAMLAFFPWYFDPSKGITQLELDLLNSLREKTPDKYIETISKIAEQYDFRAANIRKLLKGFEVRYEEHEKERLNRELANIDRKIDDYNAYIADYLRKRNDALLKLLGIDQKIATAGEDSEIMEYFLANRKLLLESVNNSTMKFYVKDYLVNFDRDAAENVINNTRSSLYSHQREDISHDDMKMLMTEIFVNDNPRLKIRVCAGYLFELNGSVSPSRNANYPPELNGYLPNTHIHDYGCMGNYTRIVTDLLRNNNYISAIEQCVASAKSLNWLDGPVMNRFFTIMWGGERGRSNKVIELPDGTVVNPLDAIKWLKEQEETNE